MAAPFCTLTPQYEGATSFDVRHDGIVVASIYHDAEAREWALSVDSRLDGLPSSFGFRTHTFDTLNDLCAFIGARVPGSVAAADASLVSARQQLGADIADAFPLSHEKAA